MSHSEKMDDIWWRDNPIAFAASPTAATANKKIRTTDPAPPPSPWTPASVRTEPADQSTLFQFKADGGLIGPLPAPGFCAYQQCSLAAKEALLPLLAAEWSELTDTFIRARWPGGSDIFYIYAPNNNVVAGCIAVDRSNFYPYISNLFVMPDQRKQGHGKTLLKHAIAFTKSMGFPDARLWCKPDLLTWYEKQGWQRDGEQDGGKVHLLRIAC